MRSASQTVNLCQSAMDRNKLKHDFEVECWHEKKAQLIADLEQLQQEMITDVSIWNEDNTSRCAILVRNLKFVDEKLQVRLRIQLTLV